MAPLELDGKYRSKTALPAEVMLAPLSAGMSPGGSPRGLSLTEARRQRSAWNTFLCHKARKNERSKLSKYRRLTRHESQPGTSRGPQVVVFGHGRR